MDTLLGASPVQAIRIFSVERQKLRLQSLNNKEIWVPGEVKRFHCIHNSRLRTHANAVQFMKPEVDCTCGVWSCTSRKNLTKTFPMMVNPLYKKNHLLFVSAQILQWGIVIEHEWGYRSEYAQIIPETIAVWPRVSGAHRKLVQRLREIYAQPLTAE